MRRGSAGGAGTYDPLDTVLIIEKPYPGSGEVPSGENVVIGTAEFGSGTVNVPVSVSEGSAYIEIYAAVFDKNGRLRSATMQAKAFSGDESVTLGFTSTDEDKVYIYAWDENQSPYCSPMQK